MLRKTVRKAKFIKPGNIVKIGIKPGRGEFRRVMAVYHDMERVRGVDIYKTYIGVRDYGHGMIFEEYLNDSFVKIKVK